MKKLLLILVLGSIFCFSCDKDEEFDIKNIHGTWQYEYTIVRDIESVDDNYLTHTLTLRSDGVFIDSNETTDLYCEGSWTYENSEFTLSYTLGTYSESKVIEIKSVNKTQLILTYNEGLYIIPGVLANPDPNNEIYNYYYELYERDSFSYRKISD